MTDAKVEGMSEDTAEAFCKLVLKNYPICHCGLAGNTLV